LWPSLEPPGIHAEQRGVRPEGVTQRVATTKPGLAGQAYGLPSASPLIENVGDRSRAGRATRERVSDRAVELGGAVAVEELRELGGVAAEALAA